MLPVVVELEMRVSLLLLKILEEWLQKYTVIMPRNVFLWLIRSHCRSLNNSWHSAKKMKPNVNFNTYIDYICDSNIKRPKFSFCVCVRKRTHENIYAKGYVPKKYLLLLRWEILFCGLMIFQSYMMT